VTGSYQMVSVLNRYGGLFTVTRELVPPHTPLRLLSGVDYLQVFNANQLQGLARLYVSARGLLGSAWSGHPDRQRGLRTYGEAHRNHAHPKLILTEYSSTSRTTAGHELKSAPRNRAASDALHSTIFTLRFRASCAINLRASKRYATN
jgi:hypothetical protein